MSLATADRLPFDMTKRAVAVFLISYALVYLQGQLIDIPLFPTADALGYVRLADNLVQRSTLAIGAESSEPSRFYLPLYPLFLAAIAELDTTFANALDCFGAEGFPSDQSTCPPAYGSALYIQMGLAAITLTMIWIAGPLLFQSQTLGWVAALVAWASGRYTLYAGQFLTENLFLPCFAVASLFLVLGLQRARLRYFLLCGIAIGLAALTRPSAQYAFYAILVAVAVGGSAMLLRQRGVSMLLGGLMLACAYLGTISPWLARNHAEFDRVFLTDGYASFILVERVAYNEMTWREFGISFLYWLPWPGENIAKAILAPQEYRRLTFDAQDSFYRSGVGRDKQVLRDRFPTEDERLSHLLETRIMGDPVKHGLVTLALAYRGIWITKYWTLVAVPVLLFLIARGIRRRQDTGFIVFTLPALFMLLFHAFVSVNIHRYNLILLPSLALATAWIALQLAEATGLTARLSAYRERFRLR